MGGQAKRRRANRKKININPKRARQKLKRRNAPRVACEQLKAVWNEEHTFRRNIEEAGLLYDANKLELDPTQKKLVAPAKYEVVKKIEMEANAARRDRSFMLRDDMMFLAKMISKHGIDEWTAMARDPDNLYQLTPKQIKGLYKKCQKVPTHYNALMMACGLQPVPDGYSLDAAK
ncbi:nucleolar protein 16-like [Varroa jacobsoni]|uniref:nucleolar protein 16-like n=1 Tax=Varroa jacobsoni TaxID=62625 RepID=UPI000BF5DE6A|nr:nucleolar protein 16-like [Varroa jacobsoni]XP_022711638.1 nucleolar protein 16-like [Varroa jacobsoni]